MSGNRERQVGERRSTDSCEIHAHDPVFASAERGRDARPREELRAMALAVIDAERERLESAGSRHCECGRGVEPPRQQNDGGFHGASLMFLAHLPGTSPHSTLWSCS